LSREAQVCELAEEYTSFAVFFEEDIKDQNGVGWVVGRCELEKGGDLELMSRKARK